MRRSWLLHLKEEDGARPTLTSMVDVVFLLLIFMLFGSFDLSERQWVADLRGRGEGVAAAPMSVTWLTVRSNEQGEIEFRVNGEAWSADPARVRETLSNLLDRNGRRAVVVDGLDGTPLQAVVDAVTLCEQAGAETVSIRTD